MEEKINELQQLLLGKKIKYRLLTGIKFYDVCNVTERAKSIVIETSQRKTFVQNLTNIDAFLEKIEILSEFESMRFLPTKKQEEKTKIKAPEIANNVSDGLMAIFNSLSTKKVFSDDDVKKAKLAVDVAGKIIDIEKVKLGYLALNYR
jgi:hypothetical protein